MNPLMILILSALILSSATLPGQAPALSKSAAIDVADNAGDSTTLDRWRSVYGSNSRTTATVRELTINVRNMSGTLPGHIRCRVVFRRQESRGHAPLPLRQRLQAHRAETGCV